MSESDSRVPVVFDLERSEERFECLKNCLVGDSEIIESENPDFEHYHSFKLSSLLETNGENSCFPNDSGVYHLKRLALVIVHLLQIAKSAKTSKIGKSAKPDYRVQPRWKDYCAETEQELIQFIEKYVNYDTVKVYRMLIGLLIMNIYLVAILREVPLLKLSEDNPYRAVESDPTNVSNPEGSTQMHYGNFYFANLNQAAEQWRKSCNGDGKGDWQKLKSDVVQYLHNNIAVECANIFNGAMALYLKLSNDYPNWRAKISYTPGLPMPRTMMLVAKRMNKATLESSKECLRSLVKEPDTSEPIVNLLVAGELKYGDVIPLSPI